MIPIPKPIIAISIVFVSLLFVPPALVARLRAMNSDKPRIHIFQDMDNQARFKAQQTGPFRDGRVMQHAVDGTVARGELRDDAHLELGRVNGTWASTLPAQFELNEAFIQRGQERYNIYCSVCHGYSGYGDGMVNQRVTEIMRDPTTSQGTTWTPAKNLHDPAVRVQSIGELYNTITNGKSTMAGYGAQVPTEDRWAIAAFLKALQRSQNAEPGDVPAGAIERLSEVNLVPQTEEGAE